MRTLDLSRQVHSLYLISGKRILFWWVSITLALTLNFSSKESYDQTDLEVFGSHLKLIWIENGSNEISDIFIVVPPTNWAEDQRTCTPS